MRCALLSFILVVGNNNNEPIWPACCWLLAGWRRIAVASLREPFFNETKGQPVVVQDGIASTGARTPRPCRFPAPRPGWRLGSPRKTTLTAGQGDTRMQGRGKAWHRHRHRQARQRRRSVVVPDELSTAPVSPLSPPLPLVASILIFVNLHTTLSLSSLRSPTLLSPSLSLSFPFSFFFLPPSSLTVALPFRPASPSQHLAWPDAR